MNGDAVPEDVHVPPAFGEIRRRRVAPKEVVDQGGRNRGTWTPGALEQEPPRSDMAHRQVCSKQRERLRMQSVGTRDALLHAADPDRTISQRDVLDADKRHFPAPKPMAVDEIEQQPISNTLLRDRGEKPLHLFLRYVPDAGGARRGDASFFRHEAEEFRAFQHFGESGRGTRAVWRTIGRCARLLAFGAIGLFPELVRADDARLVEQDTPRTIERTKQPGIAAADPTAACYPLTRPKPRRRAVGKGGPPCTSNPTVQLTVQRTACAGDLVRVAWKASEDRARVAIKGVACDLPSSGAVTVRVEEAFTLRAVATTCGIGPEASANVEIEPAPEITSFAADHAALVPGAMTTLHFTYEHADAWTIAHASPVSDPLTGGGPFGGSVRVFFQAIPAEPVLTVSGPCGAAARALAIPACPGAGPEVDLGQNDGRVAVGQNQRWLFSLSPETDRWSIETENGSFTPSSGTRSPSGEIEPVYTPARAGEASFTFFGENGCGIRGIGLTQTVWNCARPIIESFTAGATTLSVGQSTYVSYITQSRHGETGTVSSSLGNALGGVVHSPNPENRHTYTATHAGTDTVTLTVSTPCGPATASLQIVVHWRVVRG